jgi:hypothetical protein
MKIKASIWVLVFGFLLDFLGSWMKIMHLAMGDFVLTIGVLFKMVGLILLVILLFRHPKIRKFLEEKEFEDSFK